MVWGRSGCLDGDFSKCQYFTIDTTSSSNLSKSLGADLENPLNIYPCFDEDNYPQAAHND